MERRWNIRNYGYVPCYDRNTKKSGGLSWTNRWVKDVLPVLSCHVETCVLLVRECAHDDETISIKVDLQGIQLDQGEYKPEEKPTYGNIKKWIKEKYAMNASNLYIGQIKDKIGLEKRQNYNIGSGEGRVPNCPSEKEEAIMEAFRHFKLI